MATLEAQQLASLSRCLEKMFHLLTINVQKGFYVLYMFGDYPSISDRPFY